jgi:hypothetical protein
MPVRVQVGCRHLKTCTIPEVGLLTKRRCHIAKIRAHRSAPKDAQLRVGE